MWTQIDRKKYGPFSVPAQVSDILSSIQRAGFQGFLVGGSVRDFFLGQCPSGTKDHDVATNALPEKLEELFPDAKLVGKKFGVVVSNGVEIATFRKDGAYDDHRRPISVEFSSIEEDASRRDFSINALYIDVVNQKVYDSHGGLKDIGQKVIRAIGLPTQRFEEDALRLLRAARFASQLEFQIEPTTLQSMKSSARLISKISAERIRDEIDRMLLGRAPHDGFLIMEKTGLLQEVIPEIEQTSRMIWMKELRRTSVARRWAAFFWFGDIRPTSIQSALTRLRISNKDAATIEAILSAVDTIFDSNRKDQSDLIRLIKSDVFEDALELYRVDRKSEGWTQKEVESSLEPVLSLLTAASTRPLSYVSGQDLKDLGFQPGPLFSEILRMAENWALSGQVNSKKETLDCIRKTYK